MKPLHFLERLFGYLLGYGVPLAFLGMTAVAIYHSNMVQHVVSPKHYWERQAKERQQDFIDQRERLADCLSDAHQAQNRAASDLQGFESAGLSAAEATSIVNGLDIEAPQACQPFAHDMRDSYLKYLEAVNNFNSLPN